MTLHQGHRYKIWRGEKVSWQKSLINSEKPFDNTSYQEQDILWGQHFNSSKHMFCSADYTLNNNEAPINHKERHSDSNHKTIRLLFVFTTLPVSPLNSNTSSWKIRHQYWHSYWRGDCVRLCKSRALLTKCHKREMTKVSEMTKWAVILFSRDNQFSTIYLFLRRTFKGP